MHIDQRLTRAPSTVTAIPTKSRPKTFVSVARDFNTARRTQPLRFDAHGKPHIVGKVVSRASDNGMVENHRIEFNSDTLSQVARRLYETSRAKPKLVFDDRGCRLSF
jgi:hypothetical protein